jgi:hypothetical protein
MPTVRAAELAAAPIAHNWLIEGVQMEGLGACVQSLEVRHPEPVIGSEAMRPHMSVTDLDVIRQLDGDRRAAPLVAPSPPAAMPPHRQVPQ